MSIIIIGSLDQFWLPNIPCFVTQGLVKPNMQYTLNMPVFVGYYFNLPLPDVSYSHRQMQCDVL